jgi:hypothetical protein
VIIAADSPLPSCSIEQVLGAQRGQSAAAAVDEGDVEVAGAEPGQRRLELAVDGAHGGRADRAGQGGAQVGEVALGAGRAVLGGVAHEVGAAEAGEAAGERRGGARGGRGRC